MKPIVYTPEQFATLKASLDQAGRDELLNQFLIGSVKIKRPKKHVEHRRKYDPNAEETQRLLELPSLSEEDRLIYYLISMGGETGKGIGLRIGEVVGSHRNGSNLPGLQIEDLRIDGIWVRGKKDHQELMPLEPGIVSRLRVLAGDYTEGPLFWKLCSTYEDPEREVERRTKKYAREAGIVDWKYVTPHRFRAGFAKYWKKDRGKQLDEVQGLMRHKNPATTLTYTGQMDDETRKRLILGQ